jgi:hypothetical protein
MSANEGERAMSTEPESFCRKFARPVIVASILLLPPISIAYFFGMGTVIDEATGKPIEGVYVIARWQGRAVNPIHSSDTCFKVASTRSDANGRFMLWPVSWNFDPRIWERRRDLLYYARSYRLADDKTAEERIVRMRADDSAMDERHQRIVEVAWQSSCGTDDEYKRYLVPVFKAMLAEADQFVRLTGNPGYRNAFVTLLRFAGN